MDLTRGVLFTSMPKWATMTLVERMDAWGISSLVTWPRERCTMCWADRLIFHIFTEFNDAEFCCAYFRYRYWAGATGAMSANSHSLAVESGAQRDMTERPSVQLRSVEFRR